MPGMGRMSVRVVHADCREAVKDLAENSVDAVVTDPPYSLQTINKRFAKVGRNDKTWTRSGPHQRTARGFMNQTWDTGEVAHDPEWWRECYRVLKPGAHLVAFGGTRTWHRMACAIEDAGFEIRDTLCWLYGSGFPKSHNVEKAIDKSTGAKRESIGPNKNWRDPHTNADHHSRWNNASIPSEITAPATPEAAAWEGWGTALKPAYEPIVLARKPLEGTVAENVLRFGTGALNIDGCRVETLESTKREVNTAIKGGKYAQGATATDGTWGGSDIGRWPANVVTDGCDEVFALFPQSMGQQGDVRGTEASQAGGNGIYGKFGRVPFNRRAGEASAERRYTQDGSTNFSAMPGKRREAAGSAARFFFSAKADKQDRWGSRHPTVKPIDLIRWLCRLVTPPGGTILDPFAGSGTTGAAAIAEGFNAILVEREAQYVADIEERLAYYRGEGKHSLAAKNRSRVQKTLPDDGLFGSVPPDEAA